MEKTYLRNAADAATEQALNNSGMGIPVDPDVADYMGAFTEEAVTLADMMDDVLLVVNGQGEFIHYEN